MYLLEALQVDLPARVALVGAGGKTTALFQLARQLPPPVIVTTTTHLGRDQLSLADSTVAVSDLAQVAAVFERLAGVTCLYGRLLNEGRVDRPAPEVLEDLWRQAGLRGVSLLVEADGSRRLPLKAPAAHEPAVPSWVDLVIVVAGLSALGKPLGAEWVHRPDQFAALSGVEAGEPVSVEAIARVLRHPEGGLKGLPSGARRAALLNQADTAGLQAAGQRLAGLILPDYERVLVARLELKPGVFGADALTHAPDLLSSSDSAGPVLAVHVPTAGVVLAAGGSQRLGRPKQLLTWRGEPLVRHAARAALDAGVDPVLVVTGAAREGVETALAGLPVGFVHNPAWELGQSTSLQAGIRALPARTGAAVFLLSDQPQVPPALIRSLIETHRGTLAKIVAPEVDGQRANPVLFDRSTFADLLAVQGDTGGRAVFARHRVTRIPWYDDSLLLDVDTEEDYQKLLGLE